MNVHRFPLKIGTIHHSGQFSLQRIWWMGQAGWWKKDRLTSGGSNPQFPLSLFSANCLLRGQDKRRKCEEF
jgi:hypothetical protein